MKAILILNMPKNCGLCPISDNWREKGEPKGFCPMDVNDRECDFVNRPSWCPLRPIPEKDFWSKKDFADGWNACLKEIEKC